MQIGGIIKISIIAILARFMAHWYQDGSITS